MRARPGRPSPAARGRAPPRQGPTGGRLVPQSRPGYGGGARAGPRCNVARLPGLGSSSTHARRIPLRSAFFGRGAQAPRAFPCRAFQARALAAGRRRIAGGNRDPGRPRGTTPTASAERAFVIRLAMDQRLDSTLSFSVAASSSSDLSSFPDGEFDLPPSLCVISVHRLADAGAPIRVEQRAVQRPVPDLLACRGKLLLVQRARAPK